MNNSSTTYQPLYYQVVLEIRGQIDQKELNPGERLPSERELMERFNVSRVTVRKALSELRALGVIEHRGKRGNFVAKLRGHQPLIESRSLYSSTKNAGKEPSSTVLSMTTLPADDEHAALLDIEAGDPVIEICRLRNADDVPFAYERILLPGELFGAVNPWEMEHRSFIEIMRNDYHIDVAYSTQSLDPMIPSKKDAELLRLKTKRPLLRIVSKTYDRSMRLVKYTELHFNTAMMDYSFTWRD